MSVFTKQITFLTRQVENSHSSSLHLEIRYLFYSTIPGPSRQRTRSRSRSLFSCHRSHSRRSLVIILPGKEVELIIAHTLLPRLLTISLIKDIMIREDTSLDLFLSIFMKYLINSLYLYHLLALLQEET